jgi:hypothetical protein
MCGALKATLPATAAAACQMCKGTYVVLYMVIARWLT